MKFTILRYWAPACGVPMKYHFMGYPCAVAGKGKS